VPARMSRRTSLTGALADDGAAPVGPSLRTAAARARALIIVGQVAIAAVLLVGAALLAQSLITLIFIDRGYQPENLLTARLGHFGRGLPPAARPAFYKDVLERLTATPGVTHAALSDELPLTSGARRASGRTDSNPRAPIEGQLNVVTTDYFSATGIRLLRGRYFTASDVATSELVVIVNEVFAARYLHGDPLTNTVSLELDGNGRGCAPTNESPAACTNHYRVVGIVADVRHGGADGTIDADVYAARSQVMSAPPAMQFVVAKTTGDPAALAGALRSIVRTASNRGTLDQVMTMETRLMASLAGPRLYAALLGGFAAFALLIAVIGLFGGLSYAVAQRTREIGLRSALGATPTHILAMVMKQGAVMTVCGLAIGLGTAAATARYLGTFLFGIEPLDVRTFVIVGAILLGVALVACLVPARRAARLDALEALRR
jgi:putative ABC transport system permease protein